MYVTREIQKVLWTSFYIYTWKTKLSVIVWKMNSQNIYKMFYWISILDIFDSVYCLMRKVLDNLATKGIGGNTYHIVIEFVIVSQD